MWRWRRKGERGAVRKKGPRVFSLDCECVRGLHNERCISWIHGALSHVVGTYLMYTGRLNYVYLQVIIYFRLRNIHFFLLAVFVCRNGSFSCTYLFLIIRAFSTFFPSHCCDSLLALLPDTRLQMSTIYLRRCHFFSCQFFVVFFSSFLSELLLLLTLLYWSEYYVKNACKNFRSFPRSCHVMDFWLYSIIWSM